MAQFDLTNAVPFNEKPLYKQGYEDAIEKACEWLMAQNITRGRYDFINAFREAMMEE